MKHKGHLLPLFLLLQMFFSRGAFGANECYTGDESTMRRKACVGFGVEFSDICIKKFAKTDEGLVDIQRACFSSQIAAKLLGKKSIGVGCHHIPDSLSAKPNTYICICNTDLCNGSDRLNGKHFFILLASMVVATATNVLWKKTTTTL